MDDDIVTRLRHTTDYDCEMQGEAADEIESLLAIVAKLSEYGTCYGCAEFGQYGNYSHFVRTGVHVLCPWRVAKAQARKHVQK